FGTGKMGVMQGLRMDTRMTCCRREVMTDRTLSIAEGLTCTGRLRAGSASLEGDDVNPQAQNMTSRECRAEQPCHGSLKRGRPINRTQRRKGAPAQLYNDGIKKRANRGTGTVPCKEGRCSAWQWSLNRNSKTRP
ncbi:hypothetical protein chiPu_0024969, partial [Chiloscyllium punctatum]|nr:hypothetical protein [Chiloscyllium punctatum]